MEKLSKLEAKKMRVRKSFLQKAREKIFRCEECKQGAQIQRWTFIQRNHYIAPYSCNGGAYWTQSKTEVCEVVCPKCQHRNYIYTHPQKDRLLFLLKNFSTEELFTAVKKEYAPQRF